MTQSSKTQKLQETYDYAIRVGNPEMAARTLRLMARQSGETYGEHYRRRWNEQQAIPADELI